MLNDSQTIYYLLSEARALAEELAKAPQSEDECSILTRLAEVIYQAQVIAKSHIADPSAGICYPRAFIIWSRHISLHLP